MLTFLEETLHQIKQNHTDVSSLIFILPNKRAVGYLEYYLKNNTSKPTFSPKIISIDEFVEELSDINIIDPIELLFKSYTIYLKSNPELEKDDFDVYSSWATTLLNDFNEIDRYLVPSESFFNYLSSIQDMNHWYVKEERTTLIENYLKFWNSLNDFYSELKEELLKDNLGYQGLVYRKAAEDIEHYISTQGDKEHVFIGFNALNKAEETIIQELLETGNTEIYWDVDTHFYKDQKHSASLYLRKYKSTWNYYSKKDPQIIGDNFNAEKKINIVEVQKNIGQVKYIGQLLSELSTEDFNNTAIVLADKNLLQPLLQSLPKPKEKRTINISMGLAIKSIPAAVFFELLLSLHNKPSKTYYYKNVLAILNHPLSALLIPKNNSLINKISKNNLTHLSCSTLCDLHKKNETGILKILFGDWKDDSTIALKNCITILLKLKDIESEMKSGGDEQTMDQIVYYKLYTLFNKIEGLNEKFKYLKTIKTVQILFSELIPTFTLNYKGDNNKINTYKGLQIMGILESRNLDFKNVIIASVNEGVLPPGKTNSSYITYDLKQQYGLPTYSEKDVIYTNHFYRLLHRSNNITLLYNNFSDGLNTGEKSRYISQLQIEGNPNHHLQKNILSPRLSVNKIELKSVPKTEEMMSRIEEIAAQGFSPSALTSYLRNPMDFYYQRILGISEYQEVEETVAANTLGTIVHDTLESFYEPFEGCLLTTDSLKKMKSEINNEVERQFDKSFKNGDYKKGENLIIFEVAKRFVSNFINYEISEIKKGNSIKIIQIESDLVIKVPLSELPFDVTIKGRVDRVDEYNGELRIIDYKTGLVKQSDLEIKEWEGITSDYKYSKLIQVLTYALMMQEEIAFEKAEAGIISFKNLNSGFLKFSKKSIPPEKGKNPEITQKILNLFQDELKKLILEICNPKIPFTEKEI